MDQPFNAEINKHMKHVPDAEQEVTDCSEKLHRGVHAPARVQGYIGFREFTKHRSTEVHQKQRSKTTGAQEQWEMVGEQGSSEASYYAQSRSRSALLPFYA